MNSFEEALNENEEYETAKKWLQENGTFNSVDQDLRDSRSLNSNIIKTTHKITFQKNNSTEIKTEIGDDIKKLIINMYRNEL